MYSKGNSNYAHFQFIVVEMSDLFLLGGSWWNNHDLHYIRTFGTSTCNGQRPFVRSSRFMTMCEYTSNTLHTVQNIPSNH